MQIISTGFTLTVTRQWTARWKRCELTKIWFLVKSNIVVISETGDSAWTTFSSLAPANNVFLSLSFVENASQQTLFFNVGSRNGIRDVCSTVIHCCQLSSIVVHCCPLLSTVVHWCPLLSIVVHCCPLLSIGVHCCLPSPRFAMITKTNWNTMIDWLTLSVSVTALSLLNLEVNKTSEMHNIDWHIIKTVQNFFQDDMLLNFNNGSLELKVLTTCPRAAALHFVEIVKLSRASPDLLIVLMTHHQALRRCGFSRKIPIFLSRHVFRERFFE